MIKNEDGLVKCLKQNGFVVWIAEHIAINSALLRTMDLEVAPAPRKLEPINFEEFNTEIAEASVAEKPSKKTKTK